MSGFFQSVDGAPAAGYRAPRAPGAVALLPRRDAPAAVITSDYGAAVLRPALAEASLPDVRLVVVDNRFFGGNIGVTGLLTGADVARVLADEPGGQRYLLPDVCLTNGVFLDGLSPADLPRPVEIVPADGASLRRALQPRRVCAIDGDMAGSTEQTHSGGGDR